MIRRYYLSRDDRTTIVCLMTSTPIEFTKPEEFTLISRREYVEHKWKLRKQNIIEKSLRAKMRYEKVKRALID